MLHIDILHITARLHEEGTGMDDDTGCLCVGGTVTYLTYLLGNRENGDGVGSFFLQRELLYSFGWDDTRQELD